MALADDEDDRGRWRRGDVIDDHVLEKCVGEGGFGEVWRAHDRELDRVVAIKRLHWRGADHAEREKLQARFRREATMTAKLGHPHIPTVYRRGEDPYRSPYVITEFVDGVALDTRLRMVHGRPRPLPPRDAVAVAVQVADALAHAHELGVVHRDIKPANVMMRGSDGHVFVVDFGIGALLDVDRSRLTRTGSVIGSLPYIAPERVPLDSDDTAEPHAGFDVYAMACLLHECLTGRRAFDGSTEMQLIRAHHAARRPRPGDVAADLAAFDDVVVRALAVRPGDRTSSAARFRSEVLAAREAWERSTAPSDGSTVEDRQTDDLSGSGRDRASALGSPWTVGALTGLAGCGAALGLGGGPVADVALIAGGYAAGLGGAAWWRRAGGGAAG